MNGPFFGKQVSTAEHVVVSCIKTWRLQLLVLLHTVAYEQRSYDRDHSEVVNGRIVIDYLGDGNELVVVNDQLNYFVRALRPEPVLEWETGKYS